MKRIDLYNGIEPSLIVETDSGIVYSNQTNGVSCNHPKIEGILVSLRFWGVDKSICGESPSIGDVQEYISKFYLPLEILDDYIEEAWIRVKILPHTITGSPLLDFIGNEAILTYNNSD